MRFKRIVFLFSVAFLFFGLHAVAQDTTAVQWTSFGKKISEGQYELHLKGTIRQGWHVYVKDNKAAQLSGIKITFTDSSIQKDGEQQVSGGLKTINDKIFDKAQTEIAEGNIEVIQKINIKGAVPSSLKATIAFNTATDESFIPEEKRIEIAMEGGIDASAANGILIASIDLKNPVADCGDTAPQGSLLQIFFIGFVGGLIALLTPCVFPMIPLTVSFFTQSSVSKRRGIFNALLYGFFIFFIYVLLSVPFYFLPSGQGEILIK